MNRFSRPPLAHPSPASRARFMAAAARQVATAPGSWRKRLIVSGLVAVGWMTAMTALLGVRHDWSALPFGPVVLTLAPLLVAALSASAAGVSRGRAMVGAPSGALTAALVAIPVVLLVVLATVDPRAATTVASSWTAGTALRGLRCDLLVGVVALPVIACAWAVTRGLTLARPGLSGACVGLAAATWAHLVVRVHCAVSGPPHALLGHLLPALPLMVAAACLFAVPLRPRRAPGRPESRV